MTGQGGYSPLDILLVLVRRRWLIVSMIVLCMLLSAGATFYRSTAKPAVPEPDPPVQESFQASVVFNPPVFRPAFVAGLDPLLFPRMEEPFWISVARGKTLRQRVEKSLAQSLAGVSVRVQKLKDGSFRLTVGNHPDRESVAKTANVWVKELEKLLGELGRSEVKGLRTRLEKEVEDVQKRIEEAEAALNVHPGSSEENSHKPIDATHVRLSRELQRCERLYSALAMHCDALRVNETQGWAEITVIDSANAPRPPSPPAPPAAPDYKKSLLLGAALGLFFAFLLAFFAEYWTRTFADPEQTAKLQELKSYLKKGRRSDKGENQPPLP